MGMKFKCPLTETKIEKISCTNTSSHIKYIFFWNASCFRLHPTVVYIVGVADKMSLCYFIRTVSCLVTLKTLSSGGDLGRGCVLGGRSAAALVESVGGDLRGAGHRVAVDSAVQLDYRGFGGHRCVAVLCWPVITVKHNQETPVELRQDKERQLMWTQHIKSGFTCI